MSDEWVMVPRDPTEAMLGRLWLEIGDHPSKAHALDAYRAMLDAAPAAPQQVEPVAWMFDRRYGSGLSFGRPADYENEDGDTISPTPLWRHPPADEVQRLREALEYLIEKCGESDDAQYGTLGTKFVRNIARCALEGK